MYMYIVTQSIHVECFFMYISDLAETLEGMGGAFIIREDETEMATCTQNIAFTTGKKTATITINVMCHLLQQVFSQLC